MLDVYFWSTNKYALRGQEWLIRPLSCVWKDIFYAQTVPQSMQGRLGWAGLGGWLAGWLTDCFPMTKFACPYLMVSGDMTPGEEGGKKKREKSHHCWNGRVDSVGWQSWQTKSTLSFHQCNFWLLCDRPPACQAESIGSWGEGWRKEEALMAKASGRSLCPMSVFKDTLDRQEWEQGSCAKGTDKKKTAGEKNPRLV